ncbi:MAG: (2Fe-2S) ferredoxin domain-containing protein [Sulfuricella sp.]|nr:(2Fe-2S) ferredoxin domain-containing protein [Sulfuricella sp.]
MDTPTLRVCVNERFSIDSPSCGARGGKEILRLLREEAARRSLAIGVEPQICFGLCARGPNVRLAPGGRFWHGVKVEDVGGILDDLESETQGSGPSSTGAAG